jgi:tRNA A37 N6-isopentenylltransferase MiaA
VAEAQRQAVVATAQLAKRQLTWLRRESELVALPLGAPELLADAGERASSAADVGRVEALIAQILAARRA